MTPPAAAAVAPRHRRPVRSAPPPRRVSGPARAPRAAHAGAVVLPLPVRAAGAARRLPDAPLLDRLVRGRLWIGLVTAALMGIVFLQVSLLGLNAGISRDVAATEQLERGNALLRAEIAELGGTERVTETATRLGMAAPPAGSVTFVDAGRVDPSRAADRIVAPDAAGWNAGLAADLQASGTVPTDDPATGNVAATPATMTPATTPPAATPPAAAPAPAAPQAATAAPVSAPAPAAQHAAHPRTAAAPAPAATTAGAAGGAPAPE